MSQFAEAAAEASQVEMHSMLVVAVAATEVVLLVLLEAVVDVVAAEVEAAVVAEALEQESP